MSGETFNTPIHDITPDEYQRLCLGALLVPTAEWINPYAHLTEEEKLEMVKEFEPPPSRMA